MEMMFLETSLRVVVGVVCIAALAVALYLYDSAAEAREKRLKWLQRKRPSSIKTERIERWAQAFLGNRQDVLVAFAVSGLSALIFALMGAGLTVCLVLVAGVFLLVLAALSHLSKTRERKRFEAAFPEAVEMLTRSVKVGVPLDEAFLSLAERFEGDMARRFDIFQSELALGQSFREAGVRFCRGLNMPDVEFFFAVLSLNRESGSELTPTLEAMSYTLRERQKVRRKAVVLTSEIRSSAKVMAALPFVVGAVMIFLQPGIVDFYMHDLTGQIILGLCLVSIGFGMMMIRDIANISE
jgi:tight adherence protein B